MRIILNKVLMVLLFAGISQQVFAMSLGEGQMLSHIGEPFLANIALLGDYSKDVRFYQVRSTECRLFIIGKAEDACDSLYERPLTFSIRQRADEQYYLRVTAERGDELFYHIIIKSTSILSGTVFKTFDFLPEFTANPDAQQTDSNDKDIILDAAYPDGKYGIASEVQPDDENRNPGSTNGHGKYAAPDNETHHARVPHPIPGGTTSHSTKLANNASQVAGYPPEGEGSNERLREFHVKEAVGQVASLPVKAGESATIKPKRKPRATRGTRLEVKQPVQSKPQLRINESGDYADDIYQLRKDHGLIQQQVVLLEKQIGLLKEVIKLKGQIGAALASETGGATAALVSASAPLAVPVPVHSSQAKAGNDAGSGLLIRILLAVVLLLLILLWFTYRRLESMKLKVRSADITPVIFSHLSHDDRIPLDLTDTVVKPT